MSLNLQTPRQGFGKLVVTIQVLGRSANPEGKQEDNKITEDFICKSVTHAQYQRSEI